MALTNVTFNADAIKTKGGNRLAIRLVNADGSNIAGEFWTDWTHREKIKRVHDRDLVERKAEDGEIVSNEDGDLKSEIVITAMQDDYKLETFLKDQVANKYFSLFADLGEDSGTTKKYIFVPICRIKNSYASDSPGRTVDITVRPQYSSSSFTVNTVSGISSSGSITGWGVNCSITVPSGAYYSVTGV